MRIVLETADQSNGIVRPRFHFNFSRQSGQQEDGCFVSLDVLEYLAQKIIHLFLEIRDDLLFHLNVSTSGTSTTGQQYSNEVSIFKDLQIAEGFVATIGVSNAKALKPFVNASSGTVSGPIGLAGPTLLCFTEQQSFFRQRHRDALAGRLDVQGFFFHDLGLTGLGIKPVQLNNGWSELEFDSDATDQI